MEIDVRKYSARSFDWITGEILSKTGSAAQDNSETKTEEKPDSKEKEESDGNKENTGEGWKLYFHSLADS